MEIYPPRKAPTGLCLGNALLLMSVRRWDDVENIAGAWDVARTRLARSEDIAGRNIVLINSVQLIDSAIN